MVTTTTAAAAADAYAHWRDALAGKPVTIEEGHPQAGFWKLRDKAANKWLPVAIWPAKDGPARMLCRVADQTRDAAEVWSWCANWPVAKEAAKQAFETGSWPGDVPDVGHNSGDLSLAEQIRDYATMALGWLAKVGTIKTKVEADMAANYRAKLLEFRKQAADEKEAKIRPHLDAQKQINAEYNPIIAAADEAATPLRAAGGAFLAAEEEKAKREAHAKWVAEQEVARKAREQAEAERAKLMRDDPIAALTSPPDEPELPMAPLAPEPVKVSAGGQRGRRMGLKTQVSFVIEDYAAALAAVKDNPAVVEAVQKVVDQRGKAGVETPGVKRVETRVAA